MTLRGKERFELDTTVSFFCCNIRERRKRDLYKASSRISGKGLQMFKGGGSLC